MSNKAFCMFNQLNFHGACSSLIMSNFDDFYIYLNDLLEHESFDSFKKFLYNSVVKGSQHHFVDINDEIIYDINDEPVEISDFGILVASTNSSQRGIQEYLRKLGFQETEEVYNHKNDTHIILFFIPVQKFLTNIGYKK